MRILEVVDHCRREKIEAILVSYDFYKAFDTTEIEAMYKVLEKFGFGDHFIRMSKVIYKSPIACVMNNGTWSDWFKPTRGTRQGCCYSPGIFDLVVETLGLAIRQNRGIEGIEINGKTIKSGQFADDLWTALKAKEHNARKMMELLKRFENFAGLKINDEKCEVLRIGSFRDSNATFYSMRKLHWSPKCIKVLGIYIATEKENMHTYNYTQNLEKVQGILDKWRNRKLAIPGKITVINSLVGTIFAHKFLSIGSPQPTFVKEYKRMILDFIWEGGVHKISYDKLVQSEYHLGLKLQDIWSKDQALKASWINKSETKKGKGRRP